MNWWRELGYVIRRLKRRRAEQDLDEEIRAHLELEIEERVAEGVPPEEARYAALRAFGNVALAKEESRAMWGFRSLETLIQDLCHGMRMLVKHPGFAIVVVLALALGIGANTAIFSVVDAVLLRPLPYQDPGRLVMVWENNLSKGKDRNVISPANFLNWQELTR